MARRTLGQLTVQILVVAVAVYLAMVLGTLPRIAGHAGGLPAFDLRPMGYGHDEAVAFLKALAPEGRAIYRDYQQPLDFAFPALNGLATVLVILWFSQKGMLGGWSPGRALRAVACLPAVLGAGFDYAENLAVRTWLAEGATLPDAAAVEFASAMTVAKSASAAAAQALALLLALAALLCRLRRPRRL